MDHYQFIFENIAADEKEILIALLTDIEFEGFEEEGDWLKAFIPIELFEPELFDKIIENKHVKYYKSIIKEINWNQKWESEFQPVVVMNPVTQLPFAVVRANFHEPVKNAEYDLLITPKMSFGTGHHATTYLMIQQMCLLEFTEKSVIDFGTGTAVLAILAEKLGASKIIAIDNDEWSIRNAKENVEANNCNKIELVFANALVPGWKADIILANINLNIIIANLSQIKAACNPGAMVLFSGIMLQDESQVEFALIEHGFIISRCFTKDNWLIILAKG